jgi:hypothetical protein
MVTKLQSPNKVGRLLEQVNTLMSNFFGNFFGLADTRKQTPETSSNIIYLYLNNYHLFFLQFYKFSM